MEGNNETSPLNGPSSGFKWKPEDPHEVANGRQNFRSSAPKIKAQQLRPRQWFKTIWSHISRESIESHFVEIPLTVEEEQKKLNQKRSPVKLHNLFVITLLEFNIEGRAENVRGKTIRGKRNAGRDWHLEGKTKSHRWLGNEKKSFKRLRDLGEVWLSGNVHNCLVDPFRLKQNWNPSLSNAMTTSFMMFATFLSKESKAQWPRLQKLSHF